MASSSETGHVINVANFEGLISFCQGYGPAYNPGKATLTVPQLQAKLASARQVMATVMEASIAYSNAVIARAAAFRELKKLTPRLINGLSASGASAGTLKDAALMRARIMGYRIGKIKPSITEPAPRTISVSRQSYDSLTEHFSSLIGILALEPLYNPNETDLTIAALNTRLVTLHNLNHAVIDSRNKLSSLRITRNEVLYDPTTGLCALANNVKNYTRSAFGNRSAEYKNLCRIPFRAARIV